MKSRHTVRERAGGGRSATTRATTLARGPIGLLLVMLLAPLLLLLGTTQAHASGTSTSCLPKADESGCISGTVGSRSDPIEGADVQLLGEDGAEVETVTTGSDGKFAFTVDTAGTFFVKLDNETLPKGFEQTPPPAAFEGPDGSLKVTARLGGTVVPALTVRSADYDAGGTGKVEQLIQSTASGLRLGLLLALASVGLSLIYGTTGLSNFAHAEQVTLGGILGYALVNQAGLNLWLGGLVVVILCAGTGWLQDRLIWQPLRHRGLGLTQLMIVTIGLSLAAQYTFQYFVGARTVRVVQDNPSVRDLGPVTLTNQSLVAMAISIVVLAGVGYALLRTRIGRATRAVSDNPALASASGIDTDKVIRLVWTAAAGLAGLSGVLYALVTNGIKWDSGLQILLLLFAAVTLGGLGTAFGALLGSIVIGLVVEISPVLGMPGDFKYATALVILILLLLVRPQGLLGKAQRVG